MECPYCKTPLREMFEKAADARKEVRTLIVETATGEKRQVKATIYVHDRCECGTVIPQHMLSAIL